MVWANLIDENLDKLYDWNDQANKSARLLSKNMVISHRDLDPKNVLWCKDNPIIIDWESAGYINVLQDLTETAIYWSERDTGEIDKERFTTFIRAYKKRCNISQPQWGHALANGYLGKLGWLKYSLKRSLRIECSDEIEQRMGTDQVIGTVDALNRYANMICEIEEWLTNEF